MQAASEPLSAKRASDMPAPATPTSHASDASAAAWQQMRLDGVAPDELRPASPYAARALFNPARVARVFAALELDGADWCPLGTAGAVEQREHDWVPTVAGLVALGQRPGALLPAASFLVHRIPGGLGEAEEHGLAPAATHVIHDGVAAALQLLPRILAPLGVHPGDLALREALVNAVSHRSYAEDDLDKPLVVEVYLDGLRILSPGGALQRVGMVGRAGPSQTFRRNPRLHFLLKLLGFGEGQGLGVRRLREPERGRGFFPAEFMTTGSTFGVLLRVDPDAKLERRRPRVVSNTIAARAPVAPEEREGWVLAQLRSRGALTRREVQEGLGVSRALAQQVLARLRVRGSILAEEAAARAPGQRYRLA